MGDAPETIWLQAHGDCPADCTETVDYQHDDVTWCWHQINDSDIAYRRADLVDAETERLRAEVERLARENRRFRQVLEGAIDMGDMCWIGAAHVEAALAGGRDEQ